MLFVLWIGGMVVLVGSWVFFGRYLCYWIIGWIFVVVGIVGCGYVWVVWVSVVGGYCVYVWLGLFVWCVLLLLFVVVVLLDFGCVFYWCGGMVGCDCVGVGGCSMVVLVVGW